MAEEVPQPRSAGDELAQSSGALSDDARAIEFARASLARARSRARGYAAASARSNRSFLRRAAATLDEPVYSAAGPDSRDPAPLARAVGDIVAELGWAQHITVAGLAGRWPQIVGDDVAAHAQVESCEAAPAQPGAASGIQQVSVVVRADSTAWATQLRLLSATLSQRLAADLGQGYEVQMRILGPSAPSWRYGARHVPGRGPRDTYG